jgi:hypothetical protein
VLFLKLVVCAVEITLKIVNKIKKSASLGTLILKARCFGTTHNLTGLGVSMDILKTSA